MLKQEALSYPVNQDSLLPKQREIDPWESLFRRQEKGRDVLTSIEFTVSQVCNLRCEHCAVGDVLTLKDPEPAISIALLLKRLDELEHLDTLSITGGEPLYSKEMINRYIIPLLKYAHERGAKTQINSNLTKIGRAHV